MASRKFQYPRWVLSRSKIPSASRSRTAHRFSILNGFCPNEASNLLTWILYKLCFSTLGGFCLGEGCDRRVGERFRCVSVPSVGFVPGKLVGAVENGARYVCQYRAG